MNQFFQFIQNIPMQVWVLIAVFGFSALGQIGKTLSTVKQKRRLEQERHKRAEESMRTGRPVPDPVQAQASEVEARRQRLAEMQARRQAQLEELRKRRQQMVQRQTAQKTQGQSQGQPQPQARVSPPAAGQGRPVPSTPRRTGQPSSRPARTTPPRPAHPGSHSVVQASGLGVTGRPHATVHVSDSLSALEKRHLVGGIRSDTGGKPFEHATLDIHAARTSGLAKHGIRLKGRADLRRAIILSEILAKPVAMRPDRLEDFD